MFVILQYTLLFILARLPYINFILVIEFLYVWALQITYSNVEYYFIIKVFPLNYL